MLTAFGALSIDMYLPAFPAITRELAAKPGVVQLTLAAYLLSASFSQLAYGSLTDRLGRRLPLLAGCALYALGSLACAFAPSMPWLIAARVVQASGGASGMVVGRAIVRDLFDERSSAHLFSQLMLVMGAAPILAPWLGGQLLLLRGWRLIFLVLAAFGCLCFVATACGLPETHPPARRTRQGAADVLRGLWALLRDRRFLGYCLVAGFCAGTMFAYISGSSFVYIELHHISAQHFGYFFGLNAVGLIGAAQINRLLLRRWTPEAILARVLVANVVAAAGLALCGATGWGGLPGIAVFLFACLFCLGIANPNFAAAAMAPFGKKAGSASAVLGTLQFAIGGLAGAAVGLLHNGTAIPMAGTVATCALGALLAFHFLTRPGPPASKEAPDEYTLVMAED